MQQKYAKWIDFLYGPYIRAFGFLRRVFSANRARIARIKQSRGMSILLRSLAVAVLIGWILVWLFASEESRNRLTEEVRQTIGSTRPGAPE